jgi:rhodanese-related sulfurtransferase
MNRFKNTFLLKIIAASFLAMILAASLFLAGCSEILAKKEAIQISVEKVAEILKTQKDSYIILDVRTKEEFGSGHLERAVLIPVDELETRFGELAKDKPIIVYCRSGNRSAKAAAMLISKGFSPVYDMTGGINAWTGKGYPVIVENDGSGTTGASNSAGTSDGQTAGQNTDQVSGQASGQSSNQAESQESSQGSTQGTDNISAASDASAAEGVRYITADELNTKVTKSKDIIILDVRSEDSYMVKHIKGAVNIPYRDFDGRTGELDSSKEIIIYCSNNDCGLSANAVTMLAGLGFKNVSALKGGIESWLENGYPVE